MLRVNRHDGQLFALEDRLVRSIRRWYAACLPLLRFFNLSRRPFRCCRTTAQLFLPPPPPPIPIPIPIPIPCCSSRAGLRHLRARKEYARAPRCSCPRLRTTLWLMLTSSHRGMPGYFELGAPHRDIAAAIASCMESAEATDESTIKVRRTAVQLCLLCECRMRGACVGGAAEFGRLWL
jgi:hypothetical protein